MTAKAKRRLASEQQFQSTSNVNSQSDLPDNASAQSPGKPPKKSAQLVALLEAGDGVTLADMCAVTGWQAHTCRAFLTGLRKKGLELDRSHRADGASVYKLMAAEVVAQ